VLLSHKGNATVILVTADYNWKKGPAESMECTAMLLWKKSLVSEDICQQLRPQELPKIHKQGAPLRPTMSTIWTPTYHLAKHLLGLLGFHFGNSPLSLHAGPRDIMVSFDVVSLFNRVPIREDTSMLSLFCHALTFSYFSLAGRLYEQIDGMAMGSPLSTIIANFFIEGGFQGDCCS
jgi:hypothetical protein